MDKHIAIMFCVFFVCMFGGLAITDYQKNQCRVEAIKAGKSTDDIAKIYT